MPNFVNADYLLGRAQELANEAKNIYLDKDASADDLEKANRIKEEAASYHERAMKAQELDKQLNAVIENNKNQQQETETPVSEPQGFKDMGDFLIAVDNAGNPRYKGMIDPRLEKFDEKDPKMMRKDLAEAAGSSGGYLLDPERRNELMAVSAEASIVRPRATVIPMGTRQLSMPVLDQTGTDAGEPHWFGGIQVYWQAEATEKSQSEPSFREIELTANALVGYTRASEELLADSAVALESFLSGAMGFGGAVAWAEDRAFFQGNGVGQPLGILNAGVTTSVARQTQGGVTYEDLLLMESSFFSPSNSGVWIISQSQKFNVMRMTGPSGNPEYVYRPSAREGEPDMLLGRPVIFTLDRLPQGSATSVGDVMLADFSFYLIGDRRRVTVESTRLERWRFNQVSWKVTTRLDGQAWLSAPITSADGNTTVSPFVVLGAKST